jgi:hypothetical protein
VKEMIQGQFTCVQFFSRRKSFLGVSDRRLLESNDITSPFVLNVPWTGQGRFSEGSDDKRKVTSVSC